MESRRRCPVHALKATWSARVGPAAPPCPRSQRRPEHRHASSQPAPQTWVSHTPKAGGRPVLARPLAPPAHPGRTSCLCRNPHLKLLPRYSDWLERPGTSDLQFYYCNCLGRHRPCLQRRPPWSCLPPPLGQAKQQPRSGPSVLEHQAGAPRGRPERSFPCQALGQFPLHRRFLKDARGHREQVGS